MPTNVPTGLLICSYNNVPDSSVTQDCHDRLQVTGSHCRHHQETWLSRPLVSSEKLKAVNVFTVQCISWGVYVRRGHVAIAEALNSS